jgi:hypothetical protein
VKSSSEAIAPPGSGLAPKEGKWLRSAYQAFWFGLVPLVLAGVFVWAMTPEAGKEPASVLGMVQGMVRDQPVPIGIVAFTRGPTRQRGVTCPKRRVPFTSGR